MHARSLLGLILFIGILFSSSFSQSAYMPMKKWVERMQAEMPYTLCAPSGFYQTCWGLNAKKCIKIIQPQIKKCLHQLPEKSFINLSTSGYKYSARIGKCASKLLNKKLKKVAKFNYRAGKMCRKK